MTAALSDDGGAADLVEGYWDDPGWIGRQIAHFVGTGLSLARADRIVTNWRKHLAEQWAEQHGAKA